MRARVVPGRVIGGRARVPGDKSIAHRWLILAAAARGVSRLSHLPPALDVRSTAQCLARLCPRARPSLEGWIAKAGGSGERHGFTWDATPKEDLVSELVVEGEGRTALVPASGSLDCGNSGTTMRLLAGLLASAPFTSRLTGDGSLVRRPMDRVAEPLRLMGADVRTTDDHAPIVIRGGRLRGIRFRIPVPSAQVKGAILLAALAAEGETTLTEAAPTRDHTERVLAALGAPLDAREGVVTIGPFAHGPLEGAVPGDVSSAAFLVAAAALTGGAVTIEGVGLNPTRTHFLDVMERMGIRTRARSMGEVMGEPVGDLDVLPCDGLLGTTVGERELPLVIDEVPVLAALACHARGDTSFQGAGELRLKESDRLGGIAEGIRALGGDAGVDGDDLVVGGSGLRGGIAHARGDHRMAMALTVAALAATGPSEVEGTEWAEISFPGFLDTLRSLGAEIEG